MNTLSETAHAKLNLALHVRAREPDGYHRMETLFAFCEHGDLLEAAPAPALSLVIEGPFGDGLDAGAGNLVLRAAEALRTHAGIRAGASLRLVKRLPVAAGIGGGSADAAAALRLLDRLWGTALGEAALAAIGVDLGADVPACVASRTVRGERRGDVLHAIDGAALARLPALLLNPRLPCPTGPVFRGWDGVDRGALGGGDPLAAALAGRNDLEAPALALVPAIGGTLGWLAARPGAGLARMSGSGATCFALFDDPAARDAADAAAARERPGDWRLATRLR